MEPRRLLDGKVAGAGSLQRSTLRPMNICAKQRTAKASPTVGPAIGLVTADPDDERLLQDFVDDISLSAEELDLFVAIPEASIADVRKLVAALHPCSEQP